jgi:hypothetical protein
MTQHSLDWFSDSAIWGGREAISNTRVFSEKENPTPVNLEDTESLRLSSVIF